MRSCVRNTSGTAGGGQARAYSPAPSAATPWDREAFACGCHQEGVLPARRIGFGLRCFFGLRWRESYFSGLLFGGSAALCAFFCRQTIFLPLGIALSTPRRYRRRTEAPPSERKNRRDAKIAAGLRVGLDSAAVRGHNGLLATESPMP